MKRIAAAAALVFLAATGCAAATSSVPPAAHAGFAGYKWSVVAISHDGRNIPVPAQYAVFFQFTPAGQFGANEPVNYHSGTYRQTGGGFTTSDVVSTLAGYMGDNPVVLAAQSAMSAFGDGTHATATVTGNRLAVTIDDYTLTCQRDGAQVDFPPATPA